MRSRRDRDRGRVVSSIAVVSTAAFAVVSLVACSSGAPADTANLTEAQRQGLLVAQSSGCASCHGSGFTGGVGPSWQRLAGSQVTLTDGSTVTADAAYLTTAIEEPSAQLVKGYSIAMPRNSLTDAEIAQIVGYIEALG